MRSPLSLLFFLLFQRVGRSKYRQREGCGTSRLCTPQPYPDIALGPDLGHQFPSPPLNEGLCAKVQRLDGDHQAPASPVHISHYCSLGTMNIIRLCFNPVETGGVRLVWDLALRFHPSFTELHFSTLPGKNGVWYLSFINKTKFYQMMLLLPLLSAKGEYKASDHNTQFDIKLIHCLNTVTGCKLSNPKLS